MEITQEIRETVADAYGHTNGSWMNGSRVCLDDDSTISAHPGIPGASEYVATVHLPDGAWADTGADSIEDAVATILGGELDDLVAGIIDQLTDEEARDGA